MIFLFEAFITTVGIYIFALIIGLILEWANSGSFLKRLLIGYPTTFLIYNAGAIVLWICTIVFDIVLLFVRGIWSIIMGNGGEVTLLFDGPGMMDKVYIFWAVIMNLIAIWTVYLAEKKVSEEKRIDETKPSAALENKMSDDYNKFNKKFNIK